METSYFSVEFLARGKNIAKKVINLCQSCFLIDENWSIGDETLSVKSAELIAENEHL
jgi:hypothetical protein